ncbi:family 78 glycoside hydrolase catalytic domain [uncultured Draconibacterium sp.]|uniref:family 78 glycoside hydrolase catalytic domain n=1 Tax=uncultured Draconibacterium sp. TaxID=1573823 RepID=UPI002AA60126|nr:family 78 glycoside hydrolase catalytic domain [uncultured Draconibacterium sp.]
MKKLLLCLCFLAIGSLLSNAKINPTQLTCEYLKNPSVVDVLQPRLAWINVAEEGERGQIQTAFQIRVATTKDKLSDPDLWDSKKVESNASTRVEYDGDKLVSRQDCWWQVRVWDKSGEVSEWSEPAFWHMGLLNESDWQAKWIGVPWQGEETLPKPARNLGSDGNRLQELPPPAPLFRKEFNATKQIKKAVAYVTGLGYFEMYLNGKKIGDDVLVPNQTNYGKRPELSEQFIPVDDNFREYKVMYLAYDISDQMVSGANTFGAILGNGFYNPAKHWDLGYGSPRLLMQVHVTYTDGTEDVIMSNESWKVSKSPILMDMVFYGEHYDARLEQDGWCTADFDDSAWENAVLRKAPEGKLMAHTAHPDKVYETLEPVRIEKMYNGNYKVDFGVEISGWVRLKNVEGPEGHKVEINYMSNTFSGDNSYIFKGEGKENYAARFNWFVFREVEIVNWPGVLEPENICAEAINTYIEESANFETSNPLFNEVNKIWKRSQTDNMHGGIASDCPHRERSPYTGDGQVACVTVMHNFDAQNFYYKWIQDIIGAQNVETGYVPNGAPWQPGCGGGVAWGAAVNIMPWEFYVHYGAEDMLEEAYEPMKEYVRYMQTWVDDEGIMYSQRVGLNGDVLRWFNLGDWVTPGDLPADELVHTFYFWRCADITAKTAEVLGNSKEAKKYAKLAEATKEAFHKRFFDAGKGTYGNSGANIFALKMGVPETEYQRVIKALKENIKKNKGHLDTGIFGTQFFFEVLTENGMHELAYEAMNKKEEPGYGRWLTLGATTTWENWDTGGSHNHPMFGGGLVWLYRQLAGMQADEEIPGYRHIIFHPQPVEEMDFAKYYNKTPYGKAGIKWQQNEEKLNVDITVPVGCTATVILPAADFVADVKTLSDNADVKVISQAQNELVLEVGSGTYNFSN